MATNIAAAADALLRARRDRAWLEALPEGARPADAAEVAAIERLVAEGREPVGGWKVGAANPQAEPGAAPLNVVDLHLTPEPLSASRFNVTGVEAEIAYMLGRDLPPREAPYGRHEVLDAIASAHPAIEVLQSRFADPDAVDKLSALADSLSHFALVLGPSVEGWRDVAWDAEEVVLQVGGAEIKRRTAAATSASRMSRAARASR